MTGGKRPRAERPLAPEVVERRVERVAAIVLRAHALAERQDVPDPSDREACDGAAERLARLRWAERAGCAELTRLTE